MRSACSFARWNCFRTCFWNSSGARSEPSCLSLLNDFFATVMPHIYAPDWRRKNGHKTPYYMIQHRQKYVSCSPLFLEPRGLCELFEHISTDFWTPSLFPSNDPLHGDQHQYQNQHRRLATDGRSRAPHSGRISSYDCRAAALLSASPLAIHAQLTRHVRRDRWGSGC